MMMLVSYDVAQDENGEKRLRRVAKLLQNYGQRVQYSVFECLVEPAQWVELKNKLIKEINPEYDSLRFYSLGANWQKRVEHIGEVIFSPPVVDISVLVAFCTVGVKCVGDFVTDNCADTAEVLASCLAK